MSKADKRARQKENRALARAQQEREERRRRAIRFGTRAAVVVAIILGAGIVISLLSGDGDSDATTTTSEPETTTTLAETTTTAPATTVTQPDDPDLAGQSSAYLALRELPVACGGTAPPPPDLQEFAEPEEQGLDPDTPVTATVRTSCGTIVIELDPGLAPETVNSFAFLASQGFFDGIVSHRIVPGFVVQTGDPTATGTGGPGYTVPDEFPEEGFAYDRGVVAMAKSSLPDSTGSQWFIAFTDTGLPPTFNPVGTVVEGLDVLDRIEAIPVQGEQPLEALYIESLTVEVAS